MTTTSEVLLILILFFASSICQQTFNINGSNISGNNFYGSQTTQLPSQSINRGASKVPSHRSPSEGDDTKHHIKYDGTYTGNKFTYTYINHQNVHYPRMPKRDVDREPDYLASRDASVSRENDEVERRGPMTESEEWRVAQANANQ